MRRLHVSRELLLLAALLLGLVAFTSFVAIRNLEQTEGEDTFVQFSTHSSRDRGTMALFEWYRALGLNAQRIESQAFQIPADVRLLFVFAPIESIERSEAQYILEWVERGNTLFTAEDGFIFQNELWGMLDASLEGLDERVGEAGTTQPIADTLIGELHANTTSGLDLERNDHVDYLGKDLPILVRIPYGEGTVWISSAPAILSNENLRDEDNAKFAAALVSGLPAGTGVAFDEYHLGFVTDAVSPLLLAIYNTPWGWAIIFSFIVMFGYLLLGGQRLGRVVPVQRTLARRTPSEYVVSMANLFRRAGKKGMLFQHYRRSLKKRLGRPFHLDPELSDDRYVELLTRMRPEINRAELEHILGSLRRTESSELELVQSVEQSVKFGLRGN